VCYVQLLNNLDESVSSSLKEYFNTGTCERSKTGKDWEIAQKAVRNLIFFVLNLSVR